MKRRLSTASSVALLIVPVVLTLLGCSSRSVSPTPKAKAAETAQAMLPEWAPKNPSPEFLRAARVLKPLPLDFFASPVMSDAWNAASIRQKSIMWPAAYEFFGTLSDEQVQRFLQREPKYLVIPVKDLTKMQRAALDRYFDAKRTALKGSSADDPLVTLYRLGAKRDLSNVAVGFDAGETQGGGHMVHLCFHITKPDGQSEDIGSCFAQI